MIRRLRDYPEPDELARMYEKPHDHRAWGAGHQLRVDATVSLACTMLSLDHDSLIADLSCGNGEIPRRIRQHFDCRVRLGDLAPHPAHHFTGPIELTVEQLRDSLGPDYDLVDLFCLCETLEHLEDPEAILERITSVAHRLLLSTPIDERGGGTPEHVWAWGTEDIREMLVRNGWDPTDLIILVPHEGYEYQTWLATRTP